MLCPLVRAILTKQTLPVALLRLAVPIVIVYPPLKLLPVGITSAPVNAPPLAPLPPLPVSVPGNPTPLY